MTILRFSSLEVFRHIVCYLQAGEAWSLSRTCHLGERLIGDARTGEAFAKARGLPVRSWAAVVTHVNARNERLHVYVEGGCDFGLRNGCVLQQELNLSLLVKQYPAFLEAAVGANRRDMVPLLLEYGSRPTYDNLYAAVKNGNFEIAKALLKAAVLTPTEKKFLLNETVRMGHVAIIGLFLDADFPFTVDALYDNAPNIGTLEFLAAKGIMPPRDPAILARWVEAGDDAAIVFLIKQGVPANREIYDLYLEWHHDRHDMHIVLGRALHYPVALHSFIKKAYYPAGIDFRLDALGHDYALMDHHKISFPEHAEVRSRLSSMVANALQLLDPKRVKIPRNEDPGEQLFQLSCFVENNMHDLQLQLRQAVAEGDLEKVKILLDLGIADDALKSKLLEIAVRRGPESIVAFLLANKIKPSERVPGLAGARRDKGIIKLLLEKRE